MKALLIACIASALCTASLIPHEEEVLQVGVATVPKWEWEPCGYPDDPVQIRDIAVSPDPPVRGQNLTITLVGDAFSQIQDGAYADVAVKVGKLEILRKEYDLCKEARMARVGIFCPVEPGTYKVAHTVKLPARILPARYAVNIRGYTTDDYDLTCLNVWIDFWSR